MSLAVSLQPEIGFVRNPFILKVSSPTVTTYQILFEEKVIYEGSGNGNYELNISEVFEPLLSAPKFSNKYLALLIPLPPNLNYKQITVTVIDVDGNNVSAEIDVWLGGLSKSDLRYYALTDQNIFDCKFFNKNANFFFTTRSNDWCFSLRENEIYPLLFRKTSKITVKDNYNNSIDLPEGFGSFGLNLKYLRHEFFNRYSSIASYFDIYTDKLACRIGIERSVVSREVYQLLFINSFGVYEIIELCGSAIISPESNNTEQEYKSYDRLVDDFILNQSRKITQNVINVNTGLKRPEELKHLRDALSSEDVYLIVGSRQIKVILSSQDLKVDLLSNEPKEYTLTMKIAETDSDFSLNIDLDAFTIPAIHSKEFTEQFN